MAAGQLRAPSATVVISQVYTTGGNSGALCNAGYVELFHLNSTPDTLDGWALQYLSATGTGAAVVSPLPAGITLQPGQRYLVRKVAPNCSARPASAAAGLKAAGLKAAGLDPLGVGQFTVSFMGKEGDLLISAGSVDASNDFVFIVPPLS